MKRDRTTWCPKAEKKFSGGEWSEPEGLEEGPRAVRGELEAPLQAPHLDEATDEGLDGLVGTRGGHHLDPSLQVGDPGNAAIPADLEQPLVVAPGTAAGTATTTASGVRDSVRDGASDRGRGVVVASACLSCSAGRAAGREVGRVGVVEDHGAHRRLGVHHDPLGELDADLLRREQRRTARPGRRGRGRPGSRSCSACRGRRRWKRSFMVSSGRVREAPQPAQPARAATRPRPRRSPAPAPGGRGCAGTRPPPWPPRPARAPRRRR